MIELLLNAENALALGLLDQAERTYRTVLEADPRNGIAAVGLSRVALERGDETGAHALARAALEIDPENATARRMIDRLDEVARFRDAAVAGRATAAAAPGPAGGVSAAAPSAGGVASQAMIPAFAAAETARDPRSDPGGATVALDGAQSEFAEASWATAAPAATGSVAVPTRPAPGRVHGSSPGRRGPAPAPAPPAERGPEPAPAPPAEPGPEPERPSTIAVANHAAPARPGLLRRILRRS